MHIILTHEQADFDALAALFGASLLNEQALPVLPRRLNRNLRAFLTIYGREFPFVDPRDLPNEKVETVLLVDTQSLVTLKGMGKETRIRVLDHHPRRENLPADWDVTLDSVGATATLLTENLRDAKGQLSALHATLLLLGIYEDTGSLSYASTTPRDARATAWLLEQGASLKIAADYLNAPLSPDQRIVYDALIEAVEHHEINGHQIVTACADATGLDEEISSLAHKLRDLLEPDALFIFVTTSEGMRLVARSTSDAIHVGKIAAEFGGGGHPRAAAALIRKEHFTTESTEHTESKENGEKNFAEHTRNGAVLSVNSVVKKLLDILPGYIQPPITVAEIMSRGPQLLSPDTLVGKAAELMQRFGYEGYPIVKDGKVVGLLNRRAVDRAQSHHLNLTAGSLMSAGEVTVAPTDSLDTLQARMTDSGWGQIPVVENGEVIGIVTRTDLLKTLAPSIPHGAESNLAARLEIALPAARLNLIQRVAEMAAEQHVALYVVGGFVRDLLLERPSLDFDIVVEGDAIALAQALEERYGGRVTTHSRFGTAKWFLDGSKFEGLNVEGEQPSNLPTFLDFITARTEFYTKPTALPTVSSGSIKLDLHRRDFTINTLALRLDGSHYGEIHDYWGGLADLERGTVRVLHSLSFVDDPTRMLRGVRFEQRFGFDFSERTQELMHDALPLLSKLTGARIRHELDLILDEERAAAMFSRLAQLGLLEAIHASLNHADGLVGRLHEALNTPVPRDFGELPPIASLTNRRALGYMVWLLPLPAKDLHAVIKKLRFPSGLDDALLLTRKLCDELPDFAGAKNSVWAARLDHIPPLALYAASLCGIDEPLRFAIVQYLAKWRNIQPYTRGADLQERGLKPGPRYREILSRLRAAWQDGEIKSQEEETELLERLLKESKNFEA